MGRVRATYSGLTGCLVTFLLGAAVPVEAQQDEDVVFTTDVRLVTLPVTVKDADGVPVGDLDRAEFEVFEEGVQRDLAVFERHTDRPVSVVLMLDASLSTAIELRYQRESARRFIGGLLGPGAQSRDSMAIFSFSSDVEVLQPFTRAQAALASALGRVRPESGTSVYDAIHLASGELARRDTRRVIVLITDGGDTTSHRSFADAMRAAHDAEIAIYPLIVLPIRSDAGRNRGGEHALITLAGNTGGETFVQHGAASLDEAFDRVLVNLRTQYYLGFYPRLDGVQRKEIFRNIDIRVKRSGAKVFARSGYYADLDAQAVERPSGREKPANLRRLPQARSPGGEVETPPHPPPAQKKRGRPDGRPRPGIIRP